MVCSNEGVAVRVEAPGVIIWNAIPKARIAKNAAKGIHLGTAGFPIDGDARVEIDLACDGSRRLTRAAVLRASMRACEQSGILEILFARSSMIEDFGSRASRAASAHGSFPRRARTDRIVSCAPFVSLPTSANKKSFKPEFFSANASEFDLSDS